MPKRMVFAVSLPFYFLCVSITLYHLLPVTSAPAVPAALWTLGVTAEVAAAPPPITGPPLVFHATI